MKALLRLVSIRSVVAALIWGLTGIINETLLNPLPTMALLGSRAGNFVYDAISFEFYELIKEGILRLPAPTFIRRLVALVLMHLVRTIPYLVILRVVLDVEEAAAIRSTVTVAVGSTLWWLGEEFLWDAWIRPALSHRFPRLFREAMNWHNRINEWVGGNSKE